MITALVRSRDSHRFSASQATPAKPPLSSSTVPLISIGAACATPARRMASAANTAAARPAFMSQDAAAIQPVADDLAAKRIARPALPRRHHVEVTVEVNRRPLDAAVVTPDDVDAGMARGVFELADGRQQVDVGAVRAQLIANRVGAGLVFLARRIHGGNANEPRREIDDLVGSAINFGEDAIGVGGRHAGNFIPTSGRAPDKNRLPDQNCPPGKYHVSVCSDLTARRSP